MTSTPPSQRQESTRVSEPISLDAQLACVAREIKMRERVYPRWVATDKMTAAQAERELAAMRAVLDTLSALKPAEPQGTLLL